MLPKAWYPTTLGDCIDLLTGFAFCSKDYMSPHRRLPYDCSATHSKAFGKQMPAGGHLLSHTVDASEPRDALQCLLGGTVQPAIKLCAKLLTFAFIVALALHRLHTGSETWQSMQLFWPQQLKR